MNAKVDTAKIVDRVRKLLALANSPNENEAASAAEKAQAILAEYNLSMSDVAEEVPQEFTADGDMRTESRPWRRDLAVVTAQLYFCAYFYMFRKVHTPKRACGYIRYDQHNFIGAAHNILVAKMMFKYLDDAVTRLAQEGSLRVPAKERTSYQMSFKHACAMRLIVRIRQRIRAAKEGGVIKTETGTTLPALANLYEQTEAKLDEYLAPLGLKKGITKKTLNHERGALDGHVAGGEIGLDKQVGDGKGLPLIGRS